MIERVDVLVLTHRLSRTRYFSTGSNVTRDSVLVRVTDRDGRAGWGETYLVPGSVEGARELGADIIGCDPEGAVERIRAGGSHRWALGAVAVAVDDLRARQRGVSVAELYGRPIRDRVRAYASSQGYVEGRPDADAWIDEAEAVGKAGFRSLKLRIGRHPLDEELPAIRRAQAAAPDFTWMADGNGAYSMDESLRLGRAVGELGFRWLEEPLPTSDYGAYAPLAAALEIPLAGGEILETAEAAAAPIAGGSFDIVQPDVSICGGIGPLLEIAAQAAAAGIACVPHTCNGAIGLAATLQVLAVLPSVEGPAWAEPLLEHDVGENPLRSELVATPLAVHDGWVAIPQGPGLGVEVDDAVVSRHLVR